MAVLAGDATEPKAELPVARAFRTMRENCPPPKAWQECVERGKPECENTAVG